MAECGLSTSLIRPNVNVNENTNTQYQNEPQSDNEITGRGPTITLRCDCSKSNGLDSKCKCTTPLRRTHTLSVIRENDATPIASYVDQRRRGRRFATDVNSKYWAKHGLEAVTLAGDISTTPRRRDVAVASRHAGTQRWFGQTVPHWMDGPMTSNTCLSEANPRSRLVINNNLPQNTPETPPAHRRVNEPQRQASATAYGQPHLSPHFNSRPYSNERTNIGIPCDHHVTTQQRPMMQYTTNQSQPLVDERQNDVGQSAPCGETLHVPMLPHGEQLITATSQPSGMRYNFASQGRASVEPRSLRSTAPFWMEYDAQQPAATDCYNNSPSTPTTPAKKVVPGSVYNVNRGCDYAEQQYKSLPEQTRINQEPPEGGSYQRGGQQVHRCVPEMATSCQHLHSESVKSRPQDATVDKSQVEQATRQPARTEPETPQRTAPFSPDRVYQV